MAEIIHKTEQNRYELMENGVTAYLSYYTLPTSDGVRVFDHTVVPEELGGRGIGSQLAKVALDDALAQGLQVVAECSFIAHYINKHPEYQKCLANKPNV